MLSSQKRKAATGAAALDAQPRVTTPSADCQAHQTGTANIADVSSGANGAGAEEARHAV